MTKTFTIFSRKLAIYLRNHGFRILRTRTNNTYPQYDCYIFLNSPELQSAILSYQQEKEGE